MDAIVTVWPDTSTVLSAASALVPTSDTAYVRPLRSALMMSAADADGASIMFEEGGWGSSVLLSVNLSSGAVATVANTGGFDGEANVGYPAQQRQPTYKTYKYAY